MIVTIDININNFDLLPNGLGFVIMALGCSGLEPLSPRFAWAGLLCWALAVLWLVGFAVPPKAALIYAPAVMVVNCSMMWQLLGGIHDFAIDRARPDLAERATNRRIAYIAVMVSVALLGLFAQGSHNRIAAGKDLFVPGMALLVAGLIVQMLILHLIYRVRRELAT